MSFLRDCKEKPFESKGRIYFEGLKQRADNLKKYVIDETEKPINLSYNLYKTLLRLKELRAVFFSQAMPKPKHFLKDIDENDIRDAILDKCLTVKEISDEIEILENLVIKIMQKTLNHLQILPMMPDAEFDKSESDEYLTDIYSSTLNHSVLDNCEKYISILADSKEKSELLLSIEEMKNRLINLKLNPVDEVELTDDDMSEIEMEGTDSHEWLEDDELKINNPEKKEFSPTDPSPLALNSSINFNDSLRWSQFPLEKSKLSPVIPEDKEMSIVMLPPVFITHPYTIWFKIGVILSSTVLSAAAGMVTSIFFTAGFAMPVAVTVGAILGFILGLKIIYSKENDLKPIFNKSLFSSSEIENKVSSESREVSHATRSFS